MTLNKIAKTLVASGAEERRSMDKNNSPFHRMTDKEWSMFCKKGYTGPHWMICPLEPWEKFYKRFKEWKRMWPKAKDRYDNS